MTGPDDELNDDRVVVERNEEDGWNNTNGDDRNGDLTSETSSLLVQCHPSSRRRSASKRGGSLFERRKPRQSSSFCCCAAGGGGGVGGGGSVGGRRGGKKMLPLLFGVSVLFAASMILFAMWMNPELFQVTLGADNYDDDETNNKFSIRSIKAQLLVHKVHLDILGSSRHRDKHGDSSSSSSSHKDPHAPEGCESTVLLVRHCEKLNLKSHCDYQGFERAVYLSTLFGHDHERWPAPTSIYALQPSHRSNPKKRNYREIETVQAVANKFKLDINDKYGPSDNAALAEHIIDTIRRGDVCGKVILVSWKHSELPDLAQHLGTFDPVRVVWMKRTLYQKKNRLCGENERTISQNP